MNGPSDIEHVYRYHDGTKHHFDRFAQSLGYLDWGSQPRPFRTFNGAPFLALFPAPQAPGPAVAAAGAPYERLFGSPPIPEQPITAASIGHFLRHSLGLSAWKAFKGSRWPLRVNPSSGNLHPTEAYVIAGPLEDRAGADRSAAVWHYAADRHAIERRCVFDGDAWRDATGDAPHVFLVALTSIHWRESWKYGERAFRYCQHDLGHAIAAVALSAALCGWRVTMLAAWPQRAVASLVGVDRDEDFRDAEREEPACLLAVGRQSSAALEAANGTLVNAVRAGQWFGRASQLSEDHVRWTIIDEVARATEDRGRHAVSGFTVPERLVAEISSVPESSGSDAAALMLRRRSALAFDGSSFTSRPAFLRMLARTLPGPNAPWEALWWSPRIHLAIFAHRIEGLPSGLYLFARASDAVPRIRAALRSQFAWERVTESLPLWLLQQGDCRSLAERLSCDQDIAADGFFSLAMLAEFDRSLEEHGPAFYRHLFWESGVVGQILYLEAEVAGARATGIGCFYDDPVHRVLGIEPHAFQSLYHFTVGVPVEDMRLTTESGYPWG